MPDIPLACVPGAIPPDERASHFELIRHLFREAAQERRDEPEGYAFRFAPAAFAEVARFVENERKCCPFLHFAIDMAPGDGAIWLRLTGPEGTRVFLDAELPLGSAGASR